MRRLVSWLFTLGVFMIIAIGLWNFKPAWGMFESGYFYIRGLQALDAEDYLEAQQAFKTSLPHAPIPEEVMAQIAYSNAMLKEYQPALDYYWLAVEKNPKHYTSQVSIARVLWSMGWHSDALANYERLLQAYPANQPLMVEVADTYYKLANASPESDYCAKALEYYEQGLQNQGTKPLQPWLRYAETAYKVGQYDKAFELYCQIAQNENAPPEALFSFALTMSALRYQNEAKRWMQIAAEEESAINPELANLWARKAMRLESQQHSSDSTEDQLNALTESQKSCLSTLDKSPRYQSLAEESNSKRSTP